MSKRSAAQASPRSEDLTKIKFARFHFNGVNTTLLDRKTKNLNSGGVGDTDAAQVEGDADMHTLIATGVLSGSDDTDGSLEPARAAPRSEGSKSVGTPALSCLVVQQTPASSSGHSLLRSSVEVLTLDTYDDMVQPRVTQSHSIFNSNKQYVVHADQGQASKDDRSKPTESHKRSPSRSSSAKGPALDVLSNECISRVGLHAVGQEYTGMLKVLGKRLDLALRQVDYDV
jgi:hypothetical protein